MQAFLSRAVSTHRKTPRAGNKAGTKKGTVMGRELWRYPAVVWAHVAEIDYRRERIAADFQRTRRRAADRHPAAASARGRLPRPRAAEAAATDDAPSAPAERR